jgi:poly(3-hydroxybutyrate) depolymerase
VPRAWGLRDLGPHSGPARDQGARKGGDAGTSARQYILTLPENYDPKHPYILIFVPHPWGGNMQQTVSGGYFGMKKVSDNKAILVAPNGIDNAFFNQGGRDIKYFKAMPDRFNSTLCIDHKRIFPTGFSFGGMMSFALGCSMPDKFRAIGPNSGSFVSGCDKSHPGPIAVIQSHGKSDTVMPISAGNIWFILAKQLQSANNAQLAIAMNGYRKFNLPNFLRSPIPSFQISGKRRLCRLGTRPFRFIRIGAIQTGTEGFGRGL